MLRRAVLFIKQLKEVNYRIKQINVDDVVVDIQTTNIGKLILLNWWNWGIQSISFSVFACSWMRKIQTKLPSIRILWILIMLFIDIFRQPILFYENIVAADFITDRLNVKHKAWSVQWILRGLLLFNNHSRWGKRKKSLLRFSHEKASIFFFCNAVSHLYLSTQ